MSDENLKENNKKDNAEKESASMNILKKIIATIRTESRELTDAVMDSCGTGKIEQEYESAQYKLKEAKQALTGMMRKERQSSRIFDIIVENIYQKEVLIDEALAQGDETEAMKRAFEVVDLELNRDLQVESIASIATNIDYLQRQLEQSERELKDFARQLVMIKTTENVQKATETIMGNIDGADATMLSAKKSLDRIREKQKNKNSQQTIEEHLVKDFNQENSVKNITPAVLKDSKNSAQDVIKRIQDKR
jgi:phage shock protein A